MTPSRRSCRGPHGIRPRRENGRASIFSARAAKRPTSVDAEQDRRNSNRPITPTHQGGALRRMAGRAVILQQDADVELSQRKWAQQEGGLRRTAGRAVILQQWAQRGADADADVEVQLSRRRRLPWMRRGSETFSHPPRQFSGQVAEARFRGGLRCHPWTGSPPLLRRTRFRTVSDPGTATRSMSTILTQRTSTPTGKRMRVGPSADGAMAARQE